MKSLTTLFKNPFESYTSEMAFSMISCLGYYLVKKLKSLNTHQEEKLKSTQLKLKTSLDRWNYANSISEYTTLINSTYEIADPFSVLKIMMEKSLTPNIDTYNALLLNCYQNDNVISANLLKKEILDVSGPVTPNSYTLNILIKGLNKKYINLKKQYNNLKDNQTLNRKFDENTDTSDSSVGVNSGISDISSGSEDENGLKLGKSELKEKQCMKTKAHEVLLEKKKAIGKTENELNNQFDEELVEIIQNLEGQDVFMDVFTQNAILESLVEQKRLDEAWNQFMNMKQFFIPDYITYKTMLKGIKKSKFIKEVVDQTINQKDIWLERAIEILHETKCHFELDSSLLKILLEIFITHQSLEKAEDLFSEMKQLSKNEIDTNDVKCAKDLVTELTFAIMIKGYGKSGHLESAVAVFNELKGYDGVKLTDLSYCQIIKACILCNNVNLAEEFFNKMENETPNSILKSMEIYKALLNGYRIQKNFDAAMLLYYNIRLDKSLELDTTFYNSVIDICISTGNNNQINDIYLDFKLRASEDVNTQPDLKTYLMLFNSYTKLGNYLKAYDIFKFLKNRPEYQHHITDDLLYKLFNCFSQHATKEDEPTVKLIWENIKHRQIQLGVILYGQLIKYYCNIDNFNKAFEHFEECIKLGLKPGCSIYYLIVGSQIKAGFIDRAITLFRNMILRHIKRETSIYELILEGCYKFERTEEALEFVIAAIKEEMHISETLYNKVITQYIRNDELKPYERKDGLIKFYTAFTQSNIMLEIDCNSIHYITNFLSLKNIFIFDERFFFFTNDTDSNTPYDNVNNFATSQNQPKDGYYKGNYTGHNNNYNDSNNFNDKAQNFKNFDNTGFNRSKSNLYQDNTGFIPIKTDGNYNLYNQKSQDNIASYSNYNKNQTNIYANNQYAGEYNTKNNYKENYNDSNYNNYNQNQYQNYKDKQYESGFSTHHSSTNNNSYNNYNKNNSNCNSNNPNHKSYSGNNNNFYNKSTACKKKWNGNSVYDTK